MGYDGPISKIAVNGKFLTDIISNTISEQLTISFKDDKEPVTLTPKSELEGCQSFHVLVPIREGDNQPEN